MVKLRSRRRFAVPHFMVESNGVQRKSDLAQNAYWLPFSVGSRFLLAPVTRQLGVVAPGCHPGLRRLRQENGEFEARLCCTV